MVRRLLLPLLALAFFATEAASAQTLPSAQATAKPQARRTLTAREKRAAAALAKAEATAAATTIPAPDAVASAGWSGWSNDPLPQATDIGNGQHRPVTNVSVAPGMPLNQVGHGVSTDYNGRPLYRTTASTTLAPGR